MCERETDGEISNSDSEFGNSDGEVDHPDGDIDNTFDNIYENIEKIIKEPVAHTWKAAYRQHHYENRHDEFSIENCGFHQESPFILKDNAYRLLFNDADNASVLISYVDRSLQDAISPFAGLGTSELRACWVGQAVRIGLTNVNAVAEIG